jgi:hypothetical protein
MGSGKAVSVKANAGFKSSHATEWTRERVDKLNKQEIEQLKENADRLGEPELVALCTEMLKGRKGASASAASKARRGLIPRVRAFQTRGVWLQDPRTSWSGLRKSDNTIVIALWAGDVQSRDGGCACLLWAPNVDGKRPWSDTAPGRERLDHCKAAIEAKGAEGLLVQGERMEGRLPEERARTVLGIDPEMVVRFQVEERDGEYWAVWGKRAA